MDDVTRVQLKRLIAGATLMLTGSELLQLGGDIAVVGMYVILGGTALFGHGYFHSGQSVPTTDVESGE